MRNLIKMIMLFCIIAFSAFGAFGQKKSKNPIVEENKKEGTTSWLIEVPRQDCEAPEHQFCRRPQIEGYCSKTSYSAGDDLEVFVSTNPASSYSLDLYRMGYYGGKGARLMKSIPQLEGQPHNVPEAGPNNLIECKWDLAYKMQIPDDWLSGVYLGKLIAHSDSSQSYIIFIVKDSREADFMFQCADMTWQSYNRWPAWHSMYDEGQVPWKNTNGARISFDRPYSIYVNGLPMDFNPLTLGSGEFFIWEFPLTFWMEKEGYDLTYISNIDTHEDPEGLLRAKAFISAGHDEYWTEQMFENVKDAGDKGVNILFLNGNSVAGAIYLDPAGDGTPSRIIGRLPHKRSFDNEQELLGASSYGVGYADWVAKNTKHWLYKGTGLKEGDLIKELVGWEYHGYPLKNDTSNLTVLSRSKIKPNKFGRKDAPDHAATIYNLERGNFVFNAGTCFWPQPLSSPPGYQNPVCDQGEQGYQIIDFSKDNPIVQRMTKNLLSQALKTKSLISQK